MFQGPGGPGLVGSITCTGALMRSLFLQGPQHEQPDPGLWWSLVQAALPGGAVSFN